MRSTRALPLAAVLCAVAAATAQDLQQARYDLGVRLRRLERAWDAAAADTPGRATASAAMQRAVAAFFALDLGRAARELDDGYAALRALDPRDRPLLSVAVAPSVRLAAPGTAVRLRFSAAYDADAWTDDRRVNVTCTLEAPGMSTGLRSTDGVALPFETSFPRVPLDAEGDVPVSVQVTFGAPDDADARGALALETLHVAFARDLEGRLDALARAARDAASPPLEAETLRHLHRILVGLARGDAVETDLPAFRLLREAELVAAAVAEDEAYYGDDRPGQSWLRVPVGRRALPVRMLVVPRTGAAREPRPLVLALHGMGGSENLFFDGYGDGAVVRLAEQRGWYVCAPRAMPAGSAEALVDALAARFAIDRTRVYCVGHSMGAMTAVDAAQRFPGLFAKVAALGGGGRVRDGEPLSGVPFFVAAGERDFALAGARGLARALEQDGVSVEQRVYPGVEHMLVVQAALPDVFAFFDR